MAEEGPKKVVRLARRDLMGRRQVQKALTRIDGIGASMAKAIARAVGLEGTEKIGNLSDEQIEKLDDAIHDPKNYDVPPWLFNRRRDYETGEDLHLVGGDIEITERFDVERERRIRSYRGIRHERGLPVRGQRTRSTGRKGMTVGVERKKLKKLRKKEK